MNTQENNWKHVGQMTGLTFDWDKAASIINKMTTAHPNLIAYAGLEKDWIHSFDVIFKNGQPTKAKYARLASNLTVPILIIYKSPDDEYAHIFECFQYAKNSRFHALSRWDNQSLQILKQNPDEKEGSV